MSFNKRADLRCHVRHMQLPGQWELVELSRSGALIHNMTSEFEGELPTEPFDIQLGPLALKGLAKWQNGSSMGVAFSPHIDDVRVLRALARRPKDEHFPPQLLVPDDEFTSYKAEDTICTLINFMVELDSPTTDINKLRYFIEQIADMYGEEEQVEARLSDPDAPEVKPPASSNDLRQILIDKAMEGSAKTEDLPHMDINFAISRLGLDQLKSITRTFTQKKLTKVSTSLKSFKNYSSYTTLKTVLFNRIAQLVGYHDAEGSAAELLQFETAGIEALINRSSGMLENYYTSTTRIYSNLSRRYERALFGKDLIEVNKSFFDQLGDFDDMYGGYVMAHLALNPQYAPPKALKITLSKESLNFSLVAHMTFLGLKFAMDRDRICGLILMQKLMGRGMNAIKAGDFVNDCVNEANKVITDFGMRGRIGVASPPPMTSIVSNYLPNQSAQYRFMVDIFRNFEQSPHRRLALRYEDSSYAHFILRRLVNDPECLLSRRASCVIPCGNLSSHPLYLDDFSNFDLLIFKDIDQLPSNHVRDFIKLWTAFEGAIVVTFDKHSYVDYTIRPLYEILRENIVDFPSYFTSDEIYKRMVIHSLDCLAPYLGTNAPEYTVSGNLQELYLDDIYTMDYIFSQTFLNKEII